MKDRNASCSLAYGTETLRIEVPSDSLIGEFTARPAPSAGRDGELIDAALRNPVRSPRLEQLVRTGSTVAIVVDDNTRPTPTATILPHILSVLHGRGVRRQDVTIVFANGSHRLNTREEQIRILGDERYLREYRISDHDVHDTANLTSLGTTARGTPVRINSWVARADIRILIGLIKPHAFAGYTGGGKSILPGVSSLETIMADHDYHATAHPGSVLGVIEGNLIRTDIEEAAGLLSPCFIVNTVLDEEKRIVGVVAGDMIEAHREGVKLLDAMVRVDVPEVADIVVAGCSHPTSVNLYQSSNALLNCTKTLRPVVRKGGIVILASPCPEGIGDGPFHELVREAASPEAILERLSRPGFFIHDQWAAQAWAAALLHCTVFLVASGIRDAAALEMKSRPFPDVRRALDAAFEEQGPGARVTVLPDAPYIVPCLNVPSQVGGSL